MSARSKPSNNKKDKSKQCEETKSPESQPPPREVSPQPPPGTTRRWVVRLRGLPWECTEQQIREFFHGLDVVQLKIVMMPYGRSSGEGLVEFKNEDSYRLALAKHKEEIGRRYIEVNRSTGSDMDRATGRGLPERPPGAVSQRSFVIRMRGLPFSALDEDVVKFFGQKRLKPVGVHLVKDEIGRPTGFCYVEFKTVEEQSLALTLDREYIGTRYVEIYESTVTELERDMQKGLPLGIMTGGLGAPPRGPPDLETASAPQGFGPNGLGDMSQGPLSPHQLFEHNLLAAAMPPGGLVMQPATILQSLANPTYVAALSRVLEAAALPGFAHTLAPQLTAAGLVGGDFAAPLAVQYLAAPAAQYHSYDPVAHPSFDFQAGQAAGGSAAALNMAALNVAADHFATTARKFETAGAGGDPQKAIEQRVDLTAGFGKSSRPRDAASGSRGARYNPY